MGRCKFGEHEIELNSPDCIINIRTYRFFNVENEIVENELKSILNGKVIRLSNSNWAALVVLVPGLDGSTRYCVAHRRLNKITKREAFFD